MKKYGTIFRNKNRNNEEYLTYFYDLTGVVGVEYNDNRYYYVKNLQGDIIGILDSNHNRVATYEYDSWGKILSIKDSEGNMITDPNHIGLMNPFRYRSYYYDEETGWYYLNSRYYNPEWGRFISPDGMIGANQDVLSQNLYLYCSNNAVTFLDSMGTKKRRFKDIVKSIQKKAVETLEKQKAEREYKLQTLPDYSDELNKVVQKNVLSNVLIGSLGITGPLYFYMQVKPKGDWDYKRKNVWKKSINAPYLGNTGEFIFNGEIFTAERFGNYNYGFVGTAIGFPPGILFMGGGFANVGFSYELLGPYSGDSAEDHYYIKKGIKDYWSMFGW